MSKEVDENGQSSDKASVPERVPWPIRNYWLYLRFALQIAALVPEKPQGLHLTVQALLMTGDLVAISLEGRRR